MTTRTVLALVLTAPVLLSGCSTPSAPPVPEAAVATPKAHMNMLQVMRSFPFPHSNVIFDVQTWDPEGADRKESMVYSLYRWGDSDTYAGWPGVESSALALAELAPILLTPRACANGNPAPVDRPEWKRAVEGLIAAGDEIAAAARKKDMDAVGNLSEKLSNACSACHDLYRDVDLSGGTRCVQARPKS